MLDRIRNLIVRTILKNSDDTKRLRTIQAAFFGDELQDGIEHFEAYGFTSRPLAGAEAVNVSLDGNRSHALALVVTDRRYRVKNLQVGEVCIFDNLGRKIYLKKDGILIDGKDSPITVTTTSTATVNASKAIINCDLEVHGKITADGDITGGGISLDTHRHSGVEPGSGTSGEPV